jgi:hypothetical protein
MNIADIICCKLTSFKLVFKIPEDGTDVSIYFGVGKQYTAVFIILMFGSMNDYIFTN